MTPVVSAAVPNKLTVRRKMAINTSIRVKPFWLIALRDLDGVRILVDIS
jgi:hypothetical protein